MSAAKSAYELHRKLSILYIRNVKDFEFRAGNYLIWCVTPRISKNIQDRNFFFGSRAIIYYNDTVITYTIIYILYLNIQGYPQWMRLQRQLNEFIWHFFIISWFTVAANWVHPWPNNLLHRSKTTFCLILPWGRYKSLNLCG